MFKCNLGNLKKPRPKCTLSHRAIAHGHLGLKLQRKCFLFLIKKQHHHVKKHYAQKCTKAERNFPIMYLNRLRPDTYNKYFNNEKVARILGKSFRTKSYFTSCIYYLNSPLTTFLQTSHEAIVLSIISGIF